MVIATEQPLSRGPQQRPFVRFCCLLTVQAGPEGRPYSMFRQTSPSYPSTRPEEEAGLLPLSTFLTTLPFAIQSP